MTGIRITPFGTTPKFSTIVADTTLKTLPYGVDGIIRGKLRPGTPYHYIALNCYYDGAAWRAVGDGYAGVILKTPTEWILSGYGTNYSAGDVVDTHHANISVQSIIALGSANVTGNVTGNIVTRKVQTTAGTTTTVYTTGNISVGHMDPNSEYTFAEYTIPANVEAGSVATLIVNQDGSSSYPRIRVNGNIVTDTANANIQAGDVVSFQIYTSTYNNNSALASGQIKIGGYVPVVGVVVPTW